MIDDRLNVSGAGVPYVHEAPASTPVRKAKGHRALPGRQEQNTARDRIGGETPHLPAVHSLPVVAKRPELGIGYQHPIEGPFAPVERTRWSIDTYPPGAHYDGKNATFGVPAPNAQAAILEIYDQPLGGEAKLSYLMEKKDGQWQAKLGDLPEPVYYGYRFFGPNFRYTRGWTPGSGEGFREHVDEFGNRFNPNKLVTDPYARELSHDKEPPEMREAGEHAGMYSSGDADYQGRPSYLVDTAKWAPKSILFRDDTDFGMKPRIPEGDAIIYEAHTRGLTQHPSSMRLEDLLAGTTGFEDVANIPNELRGTYQGAGMMAKYLKALGFNTIELLPVQQFSDANNFWGYMTDGFFAPHRRYASDQSPGGPTREFKEMVKAFHDEGIEVWLDVVYNHTGDGGQDGHPDRVQLNALRGVDNRAYFALSHDRRNDWVSSGCGNNLDGSKPATKRMILDSLEYWCDEMGVDGFRFDLASVLGREKARGYEFNPQAQLLVAIRDFARSRNIKVVAEAWDCEASGYQVGNFPEGWGEWNGKYRDWVRDFVKSEGNAGEFKEAFAGTPSLYRRHGGPAKSVNLLTAHDGFTRADLVSYTHKQNENLSAPFGPVDGGDNNNRSWDCWVGDPQSTKRLRRRQLKNLWTLHMFARGVPMIVYGDELGRTQNGNNNPYKLDSIATQNNYAMVATAAPQRVPTEGGGHYHDNLGEEENEDGKNGLFLFSRFVTHLRKDHPCLRQESYDQVPIEFLSPGGGPHRDTEIHSVAIKIDGSPVGDSRFLLLVNTYQGGFDFQVPKAAPGKKWVRIVDTANRFENHHNFWTPEEAAPVSKGGYPVEDHAIVVLQEIDA